MFNLIDSHVFDFLYYIKVSLLTSVIVLTNKPVHLRVISAIERMTRREKLARVAGTGASQLIGQIRRRHMTVTK